MVDYTKKRSKEEFLEWISDWLNANASGLCDVLSFLKREDPYDKKMYEEAIPVFLYVKNCLGDDIEVQMSEGNDNYDAQIFTSSGLLENIEVTVAIEKNEHKKRKALSKDRLSPREFFDLAAKETPEHYVNTIQTVVQKKKLKSYPTPTTLIVPLSANVVCDDPSIFQELCERVRGDITEHPCQRIVLVERVGLFWDFVYCKMN